MTSSHVYSTGKASKRSREEWHSDFTRLRAEGMTGTAIAERFGVSHSFVYGVLNDPDGSKDRARKDSYGGRCLGCGKRTTGCDGPGPAPRFCGPCYAERHAAVHGTRSKYQAGCRCADCTRANAEARRDYMFVAGRTSRKYKNSYTPLTGKCRGCGVPWDEATPGCNTCNNRHRKRKIAA